jgi:hypothetical protein
MNTSMLIALAGALMAGSSLEPSWQTDYFQAQKDAAALKRPMAVLFGTGPDGWTKVIRMETPSAEVRKLLSENFVCVYVDTKTVAGKRLARDFDLSGSIGLVISSRGGATQAFWHQGDVSNLVMANYLRKYADPTVAVVRTETTSTPRTSFYPPTTYGSTSPSRTVTTANC